MGSVRRTPPSTPHPYLPFLALNVVVSAVTVLIVLSLFGRGGRPPATPTPSATPDVATQLAQALPTASATLEPTPTPHTYTVQPGDTLFAIAQALGVDMQALMDANGLTDPNTLDIGQVLRVPGGESGGGAPDAPATPVPGADSGLSQVEIREVSGAGALDREAVLLLNRGGQADMAGWTLEDGRGRSYTFPAFTLHNGGAVSVHTKAGRDTAIDLYWGSDQALWLPGTVITLRDAAGVAQSTFRIP